MKFVGAGIERAEEDCEPGVTPKLISQFQRTGVSFCGPDQKTQDGVFGDVPALADEILNMSELFIGQVRNQPVQKWAQKARGVLHGTEIG